MANHVATEIVPPVPTAKAKHAVEGEVRFVNGMRLNARHWLSVAVIVTIVLIATPWAWKKVERFETGPDYRIPYQLSKDYLLYERALQRLPAVDLPIIGDSVIWGEYVQPDGTLSHFLNKEGAAPGNLLSGSRAANFVNAGVNGMFPLALEGLVRYYGAPLRHRKVILHYNMLWMSSPKADLHTQKEERFNHADLVPQFCPRIPSYKADLNHRLAAVVERHFTFSQWASHLQICYFGQKNLLAWTLEEDSGNPVRYPNAFKNPFAQITLNVPVETSEPAERGPNSPRHRPWSTTGQGATRFEWVELQQSLQWAAFQRSVELLRSRGNDVFVLLGPFNEQIVMPENRVAYRRLRDGIVDWLSRNQIAFVAPEALPSQLYADGSHPLTQGYQLLAERLYTETPFRRWMETQSSDHEIHKAHEK